MVRLVLTDLPYSVASPVYQYERANHDPLHVYLLRHRLGNRLVNIPEQTLTLHAEQLEALNRLSALDRPESLAGL